jgi:uncharacterized MAPEG superfamily protein
MYYHVAFGSFYPPGDDVEVLAEGWCCLARWRGLHYRAFAGPYATRVEAQAAADRMSAAMDNLFELFERD